MNFTQKMLRKKKLKVNSKGVSPKSIRVTQEIPMNIDIQVDVEL